MNPQTTEQIQAHYAKQEKAAATVAKQNSLPTSLVREFCAASCPPSNHKWNQGNAKAWLNEQALSASELANQYQEYFLSNQAIFSKAYANCY